MKIKGKIIEAGNLAALNGRPGLLIEVDEAQLRECAENMAYAEVEVSVVNTPLTGGHPPKEVRMSDNASAGGRTVQDLVRVPISELVTYIAIAAVQDPDWPARAAGVRPHLSENTLAAIREVAKRLNDYANAPAHQRRGATYGAAGGSEVL